jgi:hypothetical protein
MTFFPFPHTHLDYRFCDRYTKSSVALIGRLCLPDEEFGQRLLRELGHEDLLGYIWVTKSIRFHAMLHNAVRGYIAVIMHKYG